MFSLGRLSRQVILHLSNFSREDGYGRTNL